MCCKAGVGRGGVCWSGVCVVGGVKEGWGGWFRVM